ncbi:alpha/beta fold hydrolase [Candidatus Poriferisodalis sp.]|uniref:alpha/beta fold hydrolase n=1 Tax=Candidatus Poriferisodalis sp. TaxID=3101277 RepID=UPI003C6ED04F
MAAPIVAGRHGCATTSRPAHAEAFTELVEELDLRDITLFLTDWGGPIGLNLAHRQPDRIKRLVVANTWCWPVKSEFHFRFFSSMMASPLGQYLIKRRNFFVNRVMPKAVADKDTLSDEVIGHYRQAQPSPAERAANAALPGYITGATDWLEAIWDNR